MAHNIAGARHTSSRRGILTKAAAVAAALAAARAAGGSRSEAANGDIIKVGHGYVGTSLTELGGDFNGQVWSVYNTSDTGSAIGMVSTLAAVFPTPSEIRPAAIFAKSGAASSQAAAVWALNTGGGPGLVAKAAGATGAIVGVAGNGDAIQAFAAGAQQSAIFAHHTGDGFGVKGAVDEGFAGVHGFAGGFGAGVHGESRNGIGVTASSGGSAAGLSASSLSGPGVVGVSNGDGDGVSGTTAGPASAGVRGRHSGGDGVAGESSGPAAAGVRGTNGGGGDGVVGLASGANGAGLRGESSGGGHGVLARATGAKGAVFGRNSAAGDGVTGRSTEGRGGSFAGKAAALRLIPSAASDHPVDGLTGDLYVDRTRRLWFCKRGGAKAMWVQLA